MTRDSGTKRWGRNENGAAVVEFAVIVFLLLIVLFGILEYAFIFYQRHFIENAAREGMRVGVRANNFSCFSEDPGKTCPSASIDRNIVVQQKVKNYLTGLYREADILPVVVVRVDATQSLEVTASAKNIFPQLLSALIPGFANLDIITYSATGRYEDPDEYELEK